MCMHIYDMCKPNIPSRLAIRHTLCAKRSELSIEEAQMIDNKQTHLERLINVFEQQADTFLLHQTSVEDYPISSLGEYDEFDNSHAVTDAPFCVYF